MHRLVKLARARRSDPRTHWEGCEEAHYTCLIQKLADEVERQEEVIDKLVKEIEENESSPCMGHLR